MMLSSASTPLIWVEVGKLVPGDVRLALFILSLILGAYSLTVLVGDYGASRTEALLVCAVGYTAHVPLAEREAAEPQSMAPA